MGLPSRFFEKKFVKDEKGDDITPFDGICFPYVANNIHAVQRGPAGDPTQPNGRHVQPRR